MDKPKVLVIELEPTLIDFSEQEYSVHPGLNAETLRAALTADQRTLGEAGFDAHLCMIDFGETAERWSGPVWRMPLLTLSCSARAYA